MLTFPLKKSKAIASRKRVVEKVSAPAIPQFDLNHPEKPTQAAFDALREGLRRIANSKDGAKHQTINKVAYYAGRFVSGQQLSYNTAYNAIYGEAIKRGNLDDVSQAERTILAALSKGMEKPFETKDKSNYPGTEKKGGRVFADAIDFIEQKYPGVYRNEMTMWLEYGENNTEISEQEANGLYIDIQAAGTPIKKMDFETLLNSNKFRSEHPVKKFFEKNAELVTPGSRANTDQLLACLTTPLPPHFLLVFVVKWLVGMIANLFSDNISPLCLVLVGPKNIGKTEYFRRILPPELKRYMAQTKFDAGKDSDALMCENLIAMSDEMDFMHKVEAKTFRNYLSSDYFVYRPPYGRKNVRRKRIASVCGTSNENNLIQDPENNRRIIPVPITAIDFKQYNSIDKSALLIELYHLYMQGYAYQLNSEDINLLVEHTTEFEIRRPEIEAILELFAVPKTKSELKESGEFTATQIAAKVQAISRQKVSPVIVGKCLKEIGFACRRVKIPGTNSSSTVYRAVEKNSYTDIIRPVGGIEPVAPGIWNNFPID